ncbi:hypothetical protein J3F83DRAFT_765501 [Trichoderma novae-zelandiae]
MEEDRWHQVVQQLLRGPNESKSALGQMSEVRIIRGYENGSLGHVWSSLAPLVKTEQQSSDRRLRSRNPPVHPPSSGGQPSHTPSSARQPSSTPSSGRQPSSIGYVEADVAPLLEDMTVRFASNFIRCVLNYAQEPETALPIHYRDERMEHKGEGPNWCAIDDGGVQVASANEEDVLQVAIVEAKRTFQAIHNGRPTVSDGLLGQIVGEALALKTTNGSIFGDEVFLIVAIKHYFKFFHFDISQQFLANFKSMDPATSASPNSYLHVKSTEWLDATDQEDRQNIICHILGLMAEAKGAQAL